MIFYRYIDEEYIIYAILAKYVEALNIGIYDMHQNFEEILSSL